MGIEQQSLKHAIQMKEGGLTAKGRLLARYVLANPEKAVFMTTRELASEVGASEATVVRFVRSLGYESYALFIRHLREHIDTAMTLVERQRIGSIEGIEADSPLNRTVLQEIENLKALTKSVDLDTARSVIELMAGVETLYVIGARLSYAPAFYMGWALGKVRSRVQIIKGSDSTGIDQLVTTQGSAAAVIVATSRYPNELLRMGRVVKRLGMPLVLLTDSSSCPLISFSDHHLVAPYQSIPYLGSPTALSCLINYLVHALAKFRGQDLKDHQERLEKAYLENDILFNLETRISN